MRITDGDLTDLEIVMRQCDEAAGQDDADAALTARDAERARAVSERHLNAHTTHVITILEERGLWDADAEDDGSK